MKVFCVLRSRVYDVHYSVHVVKRCSILEDRSGVYAMPCSRRDLERPTDGAERNTRLNGWMRVIWVWGVSFAACKGRNCESELEVGDY